MAHPLHQFSIQKLIPLHVAGWDVSFTNSALAMVLCTSVLALFFGIGASNMRLIPSRLQALVEISYKQISSMIDDNIGQKGRPYLPFVFSIFFFILGGNVLGMIPYNFTFTSHIIVTFALAFFIFLLVTLLGFVLHGFKFFGYFMPQGAPLALAPLLIPIELLSYLSRPVSMSVRLFANMMAGHTMLKVLAGFCTMMGVFAVFPLAVVTALTGFEFLVALLQAYVFSILTCLYLHDAIHLH